MTEHQNFLDAIIEEPEEDAHRLVYADYLEELGDDRGEFIRLQCQRLEYVPHTEEYKRCKRQEDKLLSKYGKRWIKELGAPAGKKHEFDRGFIRHVELRATQFLKEGPSLLQKAPLELVRLPYLKGQVQKLVDAGLLERLRGIDLSSLKLPFEQLELLLRSMPRLIRLRADNSSNPVDQDFAKAIFASPASEHIQHLQLANSRIEPSFYNVMASHHGLPSLKSLTFGNAMLGGPRPKKFKQMDWSGFERLQVRGTIRVADMQEMVHMAPLKFIDFRYGTMPERGLKAMIEGGVFEQAERIVLRGTQLSEKTLLALVQSPMPECQYLELVLELGDEACRALAANGSLSSLKMFAGWMSTKQEKTFFADWPTKRVEPEFPF